MSELVIVNGSGEVLCNLNPANVARVNGKPQYGPNVRRVLTAAEVAKVHSLPTKRQGAKFRAANFSACLVGVN